MFEVAFANINQKISGYAVTKILQNIL